MVGLKNDSVKYLLYVFLLITDIDSELSNEYEIEMEINSISFKNVRNKQKNGRCCLPSKKASLFEHRMFKHLHGPNICHFECRPLFEICMEDHCSIYNNGVNLKFNLNFDKENIELKYNIYHVLLDQTYSNESLLNSVSQTIPTQKIACPMRHFEVEPFLNFKFNQTDQSNDKTCVSEMSFSINFSILLVNSTGLSCKNAMDISLMSFTSNHFSQLMTDYYNETTENYELNEINEYNYATQIHYYHPDPVLSIRSNGVILETEWIANNSFNMKPTNFDDSNGEKPLNQLDYSSNPPDHRLFSIKSQKQPSKSFNFIVVYAILQITLFVLIMAGVVYSMEIQ